MSNLALRSYTSGLLVVDVIVDPVEPGYYVGVRPAYHVGCSILRSDGSVLADLPAIPIGYPARGYNGYVAFTADPQQLNKNILVLALWDAYPSDTAHRIADVRYGGDQLVSVMGKSPQDALAGGLNDLTQTVGSLGGILPLLLIGVVFMGMRK